MQVDELRDVHVGGDAAKRIGVGGGQSGRAFDQRNHLAQGGCRRDVEVGIERHGDDMGRRLRPGPCDAGILDKRDAERAGKRRLDGGKADFAVALQGMAVAD
jgi:hypothetical protein